MKYAPDVAGATGLVLIGWGCWQYSPPLSAVVIGSILFLLSGYAFYRRLPKRGDD